jgi:acetyltransferase-like isoleucine patch superfamily enzyme
MIFIHPSADVHSKCIGEGTRIWQFAVVMEGAIIGRDCNICAHTLIEDKVILGDNVTIKSGVFLWTGVELGNNVFVGPNAVFTNDRFPRSGDRSQPLLATVCRDGCSIGASATILPGLVIGERAMVGAGAVLTRSVPPNAIVIGSPARIVGYVDAPRSSLTALGGYPQKREVIGSAITSVEGVTLHRLPWITDVRGSLTVGEFGRSVPFAPKRYFLVLGVPNAETRGEHAHYRCHQFLVCVAGSCAVVVDDGVSREEFILDRQDIGVYIPAMTWGIQYKYSKDAVLAVFASEYYDEADYIRDYRQFIDMKMQRSAMAAGMTTEGIS